MKKLKSQQSGNTKLPTITIGKTYITVAGATGPSGDHFVRVAGWLGIDSVIYQFVTVKPDVNLRRYGVVSIRKRHGNFMFVDTAETFVRKFRDVADGDLRDT